MKRRAWRAILVGGIALSMLVYASVGVAAIETEHDDTLQNPVGPSSLQSVGPYNPLTRCFCHDGTSVWTPNNNHGLYLRPVESTVEEASIADWTQSGPTFDPADVDWVMGGLALGAERYVIDATAEVTVGVEAEYPQIGSHQWRMDSPATIRPGYPMVPADNEGFVPYGGAGNNYFTGTANLTEAATDFGCVRCHSYGAEVSVASDDVPTYTIQNWGVTCASCHVLWNKDQAQNANSANAHVRGTVYSGGQCDMCHQRSPVAASEGTLGREQQLAQRIWDTGQAGRHRDQGYENNKPRAAGGPTIPGSVETTSGAGHPVAWFGDWMDRACARCHNATGYIAHSQNGTDVPYFWEGSEAFDDPLPVDLSDDAAGVSCVACHTSHNDAKGLNTSGKRVVYSAAEGTYAFEYNQCADCHRSNQMSLLEVEDGDLGSDVKVDMGSNGHFTQREMFEGRAAYVAENEPALHRLLDVTCKACHMPVSTGQPEADASHLFRIVMPATRDEPVGQVNITTTGAETTTTAAFPDDSCTGFGCHLDTQETRDFLQEIITTRQTVVLDQYTAVKAKLDSIPDASQDAPEYEKARTNAEFVRRDGSWGIHNYYYTRNALSEADRLLDELLGLADERDLELAASDSLVPPGSDIDLSGTLTDGLGAPLAGETVTIQYSADGISWMGGPDVTTDASGDYTTTVTVDEPTIYRAMTPNDGAPVYSNEVAVTIDGGGGVIPIRIAGNDRYDTSAKLSESVFGDMSVANIVVASGADFPDALSASGLAGTVGSPILLVAKDSVPSAIADEIVRIASDDVTTTVWVVGGPVAVSPGTMADLGALPGVEATQRVFGPDRFQTSAAVCDLVAAIQGEGFVESAFAANGLNFPDALAASPIAYANGWPVLLVGQNVVPPSVATAISSNEITTTVVLGGEAVVSGGVYTALNADDRWAGSDRYGTAVDIAESAIDGGFADADYVGVASGVMFPDALSGGPVAGSYGGVMMLTAPDALPSATAGWLDDNALDIFAVDIYGGTVAVSNAVRLEILDIVNGL